MESRTFNAISAVAFTALGVLTLAKGGHDVPWYGYVDFGRGSKFVGLMLLAAGASFAWLSLRSGIDEG
jgi:hypothetical protein